MSKSKILLLLTAIIIILPGLLYGCITTEIDSTDNTTEPEAEITPETDETEETQETNMVLLVYFHRTQRCVSCTYAEDQTIYTLETHFSEEMDSGTIVFQSVDVQDNNNTDIIEKYQAYTSQLFINIVSGNDENIQHVEEIWAVIGDDEAFTQLIINKITSALEGIQ